MQKETKTSWFMSEVWICTLKNIASIRLENLLSYLFVITSPNMKGMMVRKSGTNGTIVFQLFKIEWIAAS